MTYEDVLKAIQHTDSVEASLKITNTLLLDIRQALLDKDKPTKLPESNSRKKAEYEPEANDVSVFNLPVSTSLKTALQHGGIKYLSQLRHLSAYELLQFRQMGKVNLAELIKALKDYGIDIPEFP